LLGQAKLHPQVKVLRAAGGRRRPRHGLPLTEKVLSDPELEPIRKHADAEQRFRTGMGKKGIAFLGERVTRLQDGAAFADRRARLRKVRPVGVEMVFFAGPFLDFIILPDSQNCF
jgi:hypothetical protein